MLAPSAFLASAASTLSLQQAIIPDSIHIHRDQSSESVQMPAVKEPLSLLLDNNKRPDGTTPLLWTRGKPMACDVTVPDTYTKSHIANTAVTPAAAAQTSAQKKTDKYAEVSNTHVFYLFAIETAGVWHEMVMELTQEINRCITTVTEDTRETTYLFQRLSIALQRGNVVGRLSEHHDY